MEEEQLKNLVLARIDRAKELYDESVVLYRQSSYKSSNNRAYYAMEKAINSLLATKGSAPKTHSGILKEFCRLFVKLEDTPFDKNDQIAFSEGEHIRGASDYDDFYIARKTETEDIIKNCYKMINKIIAYLLNKNMLPSNYEKIAEDRDIDLADKLDKGIDDMEAGRELPLDETFQKLNEIRESRRLS
jgi:uncharacterized protein (UPF0332 family)